MKTTLGILLFFLILSAFGCHKNNSSEQSVELPNYDWDKSNIIRFPMDVTDFHSIHSINLWVRYANGFPGKDLQIKVKITNPAHEVSVQLLSIPIRDAKGEYLGDISGDIGDITTPIPVKLEKLGKYEITLEPISSSEKIPYVMNLGISTSK